MLSFWGFSDLLTELSDWGPIFTLWSNSEENLNGALSAMAKSVEKCYVSLQELVCVQIEFWCREQRVSVLFSARILPYLRFFAPIAFFPSFVRTTLKSTKPLHSHKVKAGKISAIA